MQSSHPPRSDHTQHATRPVSAAILTAFLSALTAPLIIAAEPIAGPPVTPDEISRANTRAGKDTVTFIEVARAPSDPVPAIPSPAPSAPTAPSAAGLVERARQAAKPHENFKIGGIIYLGNPTLTELRWTHSGREWRAVSNVDFRLLSNFSEFETARAVYRWFFMYSESTIDAPSAPRGHDLPADRSRYLVLDASAADLEGNPAAFDLLDFLHAYVDANREKLVESLAARQRLDAVAKLKAAQPEPPRHLIIRYASPEAAELLK